MSQNVAFFTFLCEYHCLYTFSTCLIKIRSLKQSWQLIRAVKHENIFLSIHWKLLANKSVFFLSRTWLPDWWPWILIRSIYLVRFHQWTVQSNVSCRDYMPKQIAVTHDNRIYQIRICWWIIFIFNSAACKQNVIKFFFAIYWTILVEMSRYVQLFERK